MEKTKPAWKIVSDSDCAEETWLSGGQPNDTELVNTGAPVLAEATASLSVVQPPGVLDPFHGRTGGELPSGSLGNLVKAVGLSAAAALLGGALAGQAVHVMYYSYHLIGQALSDSSVFESWGTFYFWFNQPCTQLAYLPILFSYSMGYLARAHGLGRGATYTWLAITGLYLASVVGYIPITEHLDYSRLWLLIGGFGSIVSFVFGRRVAGALSLTIKPRTLFKAAMLGLTPAIFLLVPGTLYSYWGTLAVCLLTPCAVGWFVARAARAAKASSIGTSVSLALSACSPLVLCGLLHIPLGIWFALVMWPLDTASLPHVAFGRGLAYFLSLPLAVLISAVAGGYLGGKVDQQDLPALTMQ